MPSTTPSQQAPFSASDLEALRTREPWAVERWIYPKQPLIHHALMRHGVADRDIDDLTQEVLYQALRSLPSFRGDAKIGTWLYSIARNVACSFLEKDERWASWQPHHVSHALSTRDTWTHWTQDASSPQTVTVRREREALIQDALDALPSHYEKVIRLRDLEEYSTREAARTLGLTEVNTRVRLHRARRALNDLLAPYLHPALVR
jgi:RNA polymerase sigma-70 factor (ECF subfamily)